MKKYYMKNVALFLAAIFILSGCVGSALTKKYPDVKTYALEASRPDVDMAFSGKPVIMKVNLFSPAPIVQDAFFDYRVSNVRFETDFYNQTIVPPAEMVTTLMREWMKASPTVLYIVDKDMGPKTFYSVEGTLLDFYGDYRNESDPRAVLTLECLVTQHKAGEVTPLMQKTYKQSVRLNRISPTILAEGWSRALSAILQAFEDDFTKIVQEIERKNVSSAV